MLTVNVLFWMRSESIREVKQFAWAHTAKEMKLNMHRVSASYRSSPDASSCLLPGQRHPSVARNTSPRTHHSSLARHLAEQVISEAEENPGRLLSSWAGCFPAGDDS